MIGALPDGTPVFGDRAEARAYVADVLRTRALVAAEEQRRRLPYELVLRDENEKPRRRLRRPWRKETP